MVEKRLDSMVKNLEIELFNMYDVDGSGELSTAELLDMLDHVHQRNKEVPTAPPPTPPADLGRLLCPVARSLCSQLPCCVSVPTSWS